MNLEKTLNLTATTKPQVVDIKTARRLRLTRRIEDQIGIVQRVMSGEDPSKPHRRLSRWWWTENGQYFVFLQYARHPLELAKGKYSAQTPNLEGIVTVFKSLSQAVSEGVFDAQLADNSAKIKRRFAVKKAA